MAVSQVTLTIPPATPAGAPVMSDLILYGRRINRVDLYFPDGCAGAVGIALTHGGAQFLPLTGFVRGNGQIMSFTPLRPLGDIRRVAIVGINEAIDFDHSVIVTVDCA